MDFKAAIFDLDGTLLDSMDVWKDIDVFFLSKRGLKATPEYVSEMCARTFVDAAEYTVKMFNLPDSAEEVIEEWNSIAIDEYTNKIKLFPYALDYLKKLKSLNIKLGIATSLPEFLYKPCLESNKIYDMFDVHCSTDDVNKGKEFPDLFYHVAKKLDLKPEECIMFDDVLPAIKSAKKAGMTVYGMHDKYSAHHADEIKRIADGYLLDFSNPPLPTIQA